MGEKILAGIHAHPFSKDAVALHSGISIGAVSFPSCASIRVQLFQCADEAPYRAKHGGKNRSCT